MSLVYPLPTTTTNRYAYVPINDVLDSVYFRGQIPNSSDISLIAVIKNNAITYSSWLTTDQNNYVIRNTSMTPETFTLLRGSTLSFRLINKPDGSISLRSNEAADMYLAVKSEGGYNTLTMVKGTTSAGPIFYVEPIENNVNKSVIYGNVPYRLVQTKGSTLQNLAYDPGNNPPTFVIESIYFVPKTMPAMYKREGLQLRTLDLTDYDLRVLWTGEANEGFGNCSGWDSVKWKNCYFSDLTQAQIGYAYEYCPTSGDCTSGCFGICGSSTSLTACSPDFDTKFKTSNISPYSCEKPKYPTEPTFFQKYAIWIVIFVIVVFILIIVLIIVYNKK